MPIIFAALFNLLLIGVFGNMYDEKWNVTSGFELHRKGEVLSRRKRFLIFPEGSSIQLVFCNSFPSLTVISDIFIFGYTAALAFELPQDPYSPFNHHADPLHRRVDSKEIYYLNEYGKIIHKRPYQRKLIVNPAFAKRSVDEFYDENGELNRKQMHESHKRQFFKDPLLDKRSIEFHRTTRSALYGKIEMMLQGLGGNGKQCLLKTLCLVGQSQHNDQGSFVQEILRTVFTLPQGNSDDIHDKEYDIAMSAKESCEILYPDCNEPLQEPGLGYVAI